MTRRRRPEVPAGNRRAIAYVRVSREDQAEFSPEAQEHAIRAYAAREGLEIVALFSEAASAYKDQRAEFALVLRALAVPDAAAHVIFDRVDRSTRNLKAYVALDERVRAGALTVHHARDSFVVSAQSPPMVHAMWLQLVGWARYYSENLGSEVRKGMSGKARRGLWPNEAPIGYRNVTRADGLKVIEPTADAATVRALFASCAAGAGLTEVTALADRLGLRRRQTRRRVAKPLTRAGVAHLLRNPLYSGRVVYGDVVAPGAHAALVTPELWQAAQDALDGRRVGGRRRAGQEKEWLFAGLVRCGCGRTMTSVAAKGGRYHYLRCSRPRACQHVREDAVRAVVDEAIAALEPAAELADEVRAGLERAAGDEVTWRAGRVEALRRKADELAAFGDRAYEDVLRGVVSREQHARLAAGWADEGARVRAELAELEASAGAWHRQGALVMELARDLPGAWRKAKDISEMRAILLAVVERITIEAGATVLELAQPLARLAVVASCAGGRQGWSGSVDDVETLGAEILAWMASPGASRLVAFAQGQRESSQITHAFARPNIPSQPSSQ